MMTMDRTYVSPFAGIDMPWLVATQARMRRDHRFLIWEPFEGPVLEKIAKVELRKLLP
jgi:crotonobetaine/carnitine-CoA ligase